MKVLRAAHLGMCFGVRDAIALALSRSKSQPLTVLGDLVHNETVLKTLRDQGVKIEHQVAAVTTSAVMITAHGASDRTMDRVRAQGLQVLEATCPLVHHAHRAVAGLVRDGFHPVIIGRRDHVEVRGITEDLDGFDVVLTEDDVNALTERPPLRHRRPNNAAHRPRSRTGRIHSAAVSPFRNPLRRYGLPANQAASVGRR